MATIAEQLTSLAETKTAIKDAIVAKGVAVADTDTFRSYATKIGEISGGGGAPATKFGVSIDSLLGGVGENGYLTQPTTEGHLDFSGVVGIGYEALMYKFNGNTGIVSANFNDVKRVGQYGMNYTFREASGLSSATFNSLEYIDRYGMQGIFYGCDKLTALFFPALTSFGNNPFGLGTSSGAFRNSGVTEIHFRADAQAAVEATANYDSKWGAGSSCEIYFDL